MMTNWLKITHNNRGMALLITISVTTILIAATLEYNRRARFAVIETAATRDRLTLSYMANSGVQIAMAALIKDKAESNFDSLQEDWANPEKMEELLQEITFDTGKLTVTITDELGKIQVNALVQFPESRQFNENQVMLWDRLLRSIRSEDELKDDSDPVAIVNSVKDWLDSGDDDATTGLSGAESSYYEELDPPYPSRNGPIQDLNEMLLIKGITPAIFYDFEENPGLSNFMTVHGMIPGEGASFSWSGRININTADVPVLAALLGLENQDMAQAIFDFREEAADAKDAHDFSNPKWYKEVAGLGDAAINTNLITTTSDVFRIKSEASFNAAKTAVVAVVQRVQIPESQKWTCKVLSSKKE
jgi:general secretion pathway protein K